MTQAQNGQTVKVHYTGKLADGRIFDSSRERDPLEFTLGEGNIIPGFEAGVLGMAPGETRELTIEPADAYGERHDALVQAVPRAEIPAEIDVSVGSRLQVQQPDGQAAVVTVAEVTEETVTLDGNHPLAGATLHFEVELVEVV